MCLSPRFVLVVLVLWWLCWPCRTGGVQATVAVTPFGVWFCLVGAQLIEKAYAKYHGSFSIVEGGHVHQALVDMTGGSAEFVNLTYVWP